MQLQQKEIFLFLLNLQMPVYEHTYLYRLQVAFFCNQNQIYVC